MTRPIRVATLITSSVFATTAALAETPPFSTPVELSTRFNATGRTITIPAPISEAGQILGEVTLSIDPNDQVAVDREALVAALSPRLKPELIDHITELAPDSDNIPLEDLERLDGLTIAFSPGTMDITVNTSVASTLEQQVSLGHEQPPPPVRTPAPFSTYTNITTSMDYATDAGAIDPLNTLSFALDGATNLNGFVLENEAGLDGPFNSFLCPPTAMCSTTHTNGFKRRRTRLVKDFPDNQLRIAAGDITYTGHPLQRGGDLLGLSATHNAATFGSTNRLDTGAGSTLQLDSPATVDVIVNGRPIQQLELQTGTYHFNQLPLITGANDVRLIVNSHTGESRMVTLTAQSHPTMLAPGKSEWSAAAGVPSFQNDSARAYTTDTLAAHGHYRLGLTPSITAETHFQADTAVGMTGATLKTVNAAGYWSAGFAASGPALNPISIPGYVGQLAWEYLPQADTSGTAPAMRIAAEYRSPFFRTPGEELIGADGILYPTFAPKFSIDASYSQRLGADWQLSTSARFSLPYANSTLPGAIAATGPLWGADIAITHPLTDDLTGSLWVGYGNDSFLTFDAIGTIPAELVLGFRLAWQPDAGTSVRFESDSALRSTALYATTQSGTRTNAWTTSVAAAQTRGFPALVTATASHRGRYDTTTISHSANYDSSVFADTASLLSGRTSLRSTTAVAYAGNQVAVGPPIRDAFAIVTPHPSIADSDVIVGNITAPRATGSTTMPALVENLPSYVHTSVPLDASDIPLGYSLGDTTLSVTPGYKTGYHVEIGSNYALTAFGTLLDPQGQPLKFTTAHATPVDAKEPTIDLFTNSAGRFSIEGIGPGDWIIRAETQRGPLTYGVTIQQTPNALIDAGTLSPFEKDTTPHEPQPPRRTIRADSWGTTRITSR